jgi:hypothetical protein
VLRVLRPRNYGVADGDADGEGDSSAVAAFFFLGEGDSDVSDVVDFFFVDAAVVPAVDFFLVEVDAAVVEVEVASSFFCAQETTKLAATRAMIQDKTDFFIGMVKRSRVFGRRTNRKQLIISWPSKIAPGPVAREVRAFACRFASRVL